MKSWDKKVKKMDGVDVALVKLSVAALVLFIVTTWPAAMDLAVSINPWWFLVAFVILAIRPLYRAYLK